MPNFQKTKEESMVVELWRQ